MDSNYLIDETDRRSPKFWREKHPIHTVRGTKKIHELYPKKMRVMKAIKESLMEMLDEQATKVANQIEPEKRANIGEEKWIEAMVEPGQTAKQWVSRMKRKMKKPKKKKMSRKRRLEKKFGTYIPLAKKQKKDEDEVFEEERDRLKEHPTWESRRRDQEEMNEEDTNSSRQERRKQDKMSIQQMVEMGTTDDQQKTFQQKLMERMKGVQKRQILDFDDYHIRAVEEALTKNTDWSGKCNERGVAKAIGEKILKEKERWSKIQITFISEMAKNPWVSIEEMIQNNSDLEMDLKIQLEAGELTEEHKRIINWGLKQGKMPCRFMKGKEHKEQWGKTYTLFHPTKGSLSKPVDEAMAANTETIKSLCKEIKDQDALTAMANITASYIPPFFLLSTLKSQTKSR